MRLLILTQYFPPEMGAPQARLSELGERLVDRGWQVEVLTALPNYPTGSVFPGYARGRPVVEQIGRLRTIRVPLYTSKAGFSRRLASYFSFAASARWHAPGRCAVPDLLWVESPPLFLAYGAWSLCRRWRTKYVFNVSDLWPESAIRMGVVRPGLATRLASRLEAQAYRRAVGVTGQSDEIIAGVRRLAPLVPTAVITNGVAPERFGKHWADDEARRLVGTEPGPVFMYAGLLGLAQGLDQLLDVARDLPATVPGRFVLVGDGPAREHLAARIAQKRLPRVKLLPAQPRERVPALLAAADVAVISLGMSIPGAVPSKIYEAMASELPILLIADGEPARRVAEADCGLAVPPGALDAARQAVEQLATNAELRQRWGKAGRVAAETRYHRDAIADRLDTFLRGLAPGGG